ncbi:MAG TPA: radical SAM protein [Polyangia bacterium]
MTASPGNGTLLSATRGLCDVCGALTDAAVVIRDDRVILRKWCLAHGPTEALVSSDVGWYLDSLGYVKPPTAPRARAVAGYAGCPDSCGLCPAHEQHTCVPLLEITDACDLDCPICLVGRRGHGHVPVAAVARMVDELVRCEGAINMLTLSGGEPTRHPDLLAIVDACRRPEVGIVSLSTNGLALLADDDLTKALRDRGVVISLQLDGFTPGTTAALRGRADLADRKRRLVDRLLTLGARLSLTMTLARGVNEHEVPAVLDLLLREDAVVSLMVQPLARTHRGLARHAADPMDAITIPDVVRLLAAGSGGVLERSDFSPLPCSHPSCFALTYLLRTAEGVTPLPRLIERDVYLDVIKNQALLNTDVDTLARIKDALYALWSSSGMVPDRDAVLRTVKQLLVDLNGLGRGAPHRDVLALGVKRVKSIFIHHFMDRSTFDLARVVKCCNHYPQPDGRLLPACVRNNLAAYRPAE